MEVEEVLAHFGSQANICRVLDLGRATVNAWQKLRIGSAPKGKYVPEICAWRLQHYSRGKLKCDPELYDRLYNRHPVPYRDVRKTIQSKSRHRRVNGT